jgi:hypothetical protein
VAVPADDLAFLDLGKDRFPPVVRHLLRDVEVLVAEMVELENDRIGFAAVDARVVREVLEEQSGAFRVAPSIPGLGETDVLLAVL